MKNNKYKIILVDDESDILEFVGYNLRKEGFQVFEAINGKEAIEQSKLQNPHLILLDVMMPDIDGVETCKQIKNLKLSNKPVIIFLSARSEDFLQAAAISAKADDYITKPVKPSILINRINEILNRNPFNKSDKNELEIGDLKINIQTTIVTKNNHKFLLTKKQFEILLLLTSSPNKIFSIEEIFEKVWKADFNCSQMFIDEYIRKICEKTGIDNIKRVNGDGYKFEI